MRWRYLVPRLLLVAVLIGFVLFGFDPTCRLGLSYTLQTVLGRPVRVGDLETAVWPPSLAIRSLDVAEDDRLDQSEFEVGRVSMSLSKAAVKQRRLVADEIRLEDVRWNVPAKYEAIEVDEATADEESAWMRALKERASAAMADMADSVQERAKRQLDVNRLETVRLGRQKEKTYRELAALLEREVRSLRRRAQSLEAEGRLIKAAPQSYLDPVKIEALVTEAAAVRDQIRFLKDETLALRTRIPDDLADLRAAKDRDIANAKATIASIRAEPAQLTEAFLGEPAAEAIDTVLRWTGMVQRMRQSGDWDSVEVERHRGRDIDFLGLPPQPLLAAKLCAVSGTAIQDGVEWPFETELRDIVIAPRTQRAPIGFTWSSGGPTQIDADGTLMVGRDLQGDHPIGLVARYRIDDDHPLDVNLGDRVLTHLSASGRGIEGEVELSGRRLVGTLAVTLDDFSSDVQTERASLAPLLNALCLKRPEITATVAFTYDPAVGRPECRIESDEVRRFASDLVGRRDELMAASLQAARIETDTLVTRYMSKWQGRIDQSLAKYDLDAAALLDKIEVARTLLRNPSLDNITQVAAEHLPEYLSDDLQPIASQVLDSGVLSQLPKPGQPLGESLGQTVRTASAIPIVQEQKAELSGKLNDRLGGELSELTGAIRPSSDLLRFGQGASGETPSASPTPLLRGLGLPIGDRTGQAKPVRQDQTPGERPRLLPGLFGR